jgi:hypothetical protein
MVRLLFEFLGGNVMKVRVNHAALRTGPSGEWGYLLVSSPEVRGFDSVEVRGIEAEVLRKIESRLAQLKGTDEVLTIQADFDVEERVEEFTTKLGEAASKRVARLYLASVAKWAIEAKPNLTGNVADIFGNPAAPAADNDPF